MELLQYKIVIALLVIVSISLLPILAWKKTRRTVHLTGLLYLLFIYIYQDFAFGKINATHDTYWTYTYFYSFARQWIASGVAFGWNPYLGGGQPLSLLSNYLLHSPVFISAKLFSFLGWNFSYEQFFSLMWVFNHLWICTGMYLLLYLLLDSSMPALFGLVTLLLGGFFAAELAAPNSYGLMFLSYLLFFIILFWKHKKWGGMYLFAAFLGLAVNYYNPAYLFIDLLILLLSYLLVNIRDIKSIIGRLFGLIKEKPYSIALAVILFVLPALPFVYSYFEMRDYVSPTRGFTQRGQTVSNTGFQPSAVAPLASYKVLYDWDINDFFWNTHTSFYIGFLPVVLICAAPLFFIASSEFRKRSGVFFISALFLAAVGTGSSSSIPLWSWLENLPFFNMIRHTFPFARAVAFLLILVSSETLLQIFKISSFSWLRLTTRLPIKNIALFFLFALHIGLLIYFSNMRIHNLPVKSDTVAPKEKLQLKEFVYPSEWSLYGRQSPPIPYDLTGMTQKQSILSNSDPEFNFMAHKDFIPFLRNVSREDYDNGFFVRPLEYQLYKKDLLLPTTVNSGASDIYAELGFRKKNTYSPIYATVETNSVEKKGTAKEIYKAIDGDFNSYWQIDKIKKKDSFTWLSITFPSEIKIYGIRITPHKIDKLWSSDRAEIRISRDGKKWESLQKLDLRNALVNSSDASLLFPFKTAVTARFFRLWVDDKNFGSLAEIEFIDEPVADTNMAASKKVEVLNISNTVVRASSRYSAHTEDLAFDNDIATFWHVNIPPEESHWISIEFPAGMAFNGVQFVPRQDESQMWDSFRQMESKLELQISEDGEKWISVPQKKSAYNKAFLFSLDKMVTAKHVRFLIHDKSRKFLSVAEIQLLRLPEGFWGDAFSPSQAGTVESLESNNPNKIYLKVHAEKDANLVRLENYHRGWNVYLDNKEVALQNVGPNLQLIPIPAGNHEVRMEFCSWYNVIAWLHICFFVFVFLWFMIYLRSVKIV